MIRSSSKSVSDFPMNAKAAEAELIQKAAQTAIIAARSILLSGGTEESALKTAKAAAESVLNPAASDSDTVSGRSRAAFGGKKRKAKRQAEVVASMALISATSLHPNGNVMMGECNSINKMYGRNIITVHQDEPSVLSGSVRTSKTKSTTPKAQASHNGFMDRSQHERTSATMQMYSRRDLPPLSSQLQPTSPTQSVLSAALNNVLSPKSEKAELNVKALCESMSSDIENQSSIETSLEGISQSQSQSQSEDESDEDTTHFFSEDMKEEKCFKKSSSKPKSSCSLTDVLISPFAATLKILQCGQIVVGDAGGDVKLLTSRRNDRRNRHQGRQSRRGRRQQDSMFDSRDDSFDDDQTEFSDDNLKRKGEYRDPDFTGSYSYTSSHSEISDVSEGNIQVRSSIRDTMETIVNRSKSSYNKSKLNENKRSQRRNKPIEERLWKSFEATKPRQKQKTRSNASVSSKSKRPPRVTSPTSMKKRASSFFKRDKGRR